MKKILMSFVCMMVMACSSLGLQPAQSFDDKLAYAYGTVASVRTTAAQKLTNGSMTLPDAERVQNLADQTRALLDAARIDEHVDMNLATGKLILATSILTQLQTFVNDHGGSQ